MEKLTRCKVGLRLFTDFVHKLDQRSYYGAKDEKAEMASDALYLSRLTSAEEKYDKHVETCEQCSSFESKTT